MRSGSSILTYLTVAMALVVCQGAVVADSAQTSKVKGILQQQDQNASQGSLTFTRKTTQADNGISKADYIAQARRNAMAQGTSAKDFDTNLLKIYEAAAEQEQLSKHTTTQTTLSYTRDARYVNTSATTLSNGTTTVSTHIYDGKSEYSITNIDGRNQVSIYPPEPSSKKSTYRMITLSPGPSFVFGRGLASLTSVKVSGSDSTIMIEGQAVDGTKIKAVLDPNRAYLAKLIERMDEKGRVMNKITLTQPVQAQNGTWFASKSIFEAPPGNSKTPPDFREDYSITKADFSTPDESLFKVSMHQGQTIVDGRLGNPVVFEKTKPGEITADQLLPLSRQQLEQSARLQAQSDARQRAESLKRIALFGLPLLLLVGVVGVRLLRQRSRAA